MLATAAAMAGSPSEMTTSGWILKTRRKALNVHSNVVVVSYTGGGAGEGRHIVREGTS
jgi:hypothetical protein